MSENEERIPTMYRIVKKNGETMTFWKEDVAPLMNEAVKYIDFIKEHCPAEHEAALEMLKDDKEAEHDSAVNKGFKLFVSGLCDGGE